MKWIPIKGNPPIEHGLYLIKYAYAGAARVEWYTWGFAIWNGMAWNHLVANGGRRVRAYIFMLKIEEE